MCRIKDTLWPEIRGSDHKALINFFTLLKAVDDKTPVFGISPTDHIKLLKKAKASSAGVSLTIHRSLFDFFYINNVYNITSIKIKNTYKLSSTRVTIIIGEYIENIVNKLNLIM